MYLMIMYSRSVNLLGLRRQADRQHYVILRRRAVVFKCLTYSTFDDVTYDVILPLGWAGSNFFMCAKFGCCPTVVSKKKGGGVQTDRQRKLQLYIVDES